MRENRQSGSEGGGAGNSTGPPYPYAALVPSGRLRRPRKDPNVSSRASPAAGIACQPSRRDKGGQPRISILGAGGPRIFTFASIWRRSASRWVPFASRGERFASARGPSPA